MSEKVVAPPKGVHDRPSYKDAFGRVVLRWLRRKGARPSSRKFFSGSFASQALASEERRIHFMNSVFYKFLKYTHISLMKKTYSLGELSGWRVLSFLTRGEKARHNRCVDFDIGPVSQE